MSKPNYEAELESQLEDAEIVSNCCWARIYDNILICSDCRDHCWEMKVLPDWTTFEYIDDKWILTNY